MIDGTLVHNGDVIGQVYGVKIINENKFAAERVEFEQKYIVSGGHGGTYSYIDFGMQPSAIHMFLEDKVFWGISIDKFFDASGDQNKLSADRADAITTTTNGIKSEFWKKL